jgi:hypothetical protein
LVFAGTKTGPLNWSRIIRGMKILVFVIRLANGHQTEIIRLTFRWSRTQSQLDPDASKLWRPACSRGVPPSPTPQGLHTPAGSSLAVTTSSRPVRLVTRTAVGRSPSRAGPQRVSALQVALGLRLAESGSTRTLPGLEVRRSDPSPITMSDSET